MRYTILGERCSGTNWLQTLIHDNFKIKIDWLGGWKHFFNFDGYEERIINNDDVLYICIVRNPIDYFVSFFEKAHHQPIERLTNINDFLLSEFYSVESKINNSEILHDRKIGNIRYKNIFEMRSSKCRFLFDRMPIITKKYKFINYEKLKYNTYDVLSSIHDEFRLTLKNTDFYIEKKYNGKVDNVKCREDYCVSDSTRKIILDNLDYEIENKMGYLLYLK